MALRATLIKAPCPTHGVTSHRIYGARGRRAQCLVCERVKRSDAAKRAVVTRRRKREKRARLGHGLATYTELLQTCDDLWSIVCRAEAEGCAMCRTLLPPEELQWAHHLPRGKPQFLRYDPRNWSALCAACHRRHTPPGTAWWRWLEQERLGKEIWLRLKLDAESRGKLRTRDLELLILDAQVWIAAVPPGARREWALERRDIVLRRSRAA